MRNLELDKLITAAQTLVFVREELMEDFTSDYPTYRLSGLEQIQIMAKLDDAIERVKVIIMEAEALEAGRS